MFTVTNVPADARVAGPTETAAVPVYMGPTNVPAAERVAGPTLSAAVAVYVVDASPDGQHFRFPTGFLVHFFR